MTSKTEERLAEIHDRLSLEAPIVALEAAPELSTGLEQGVA
jgi:hypothetical protein